MHQLYILTGPTAVGKTSLSIQWAQENNAEILSCDSLLLYRGMNIGTAKPTMEEMESVWHHGIDVVPVNYQYSVKEYLDMSVHIVESILQRGKNILIVGGSGFYLKSFLAPVVDNIEVSDAIKEQVRLIEEEQGLIGLVEKLQSFNPDGIHDIDLNNPRRVVKALQRCMMTGKTLAVLKEDFEKSSYPFEDYKKKVCLLQRDEHELKERIVQRVKIMIEDGLVDEVKGLIMEGLLDNPSATNAIGYRETIDWIAEGDGDLDKLEAEIIKNTNQLVAKQRKWFRHQLNPDNILLLSDSISNPEKLLF